MRYCMFSDIHGNYDALKACLHSFKDDCIDQFIFIGDVIGYCACPHECIQLLKDLSPSLLVAGNHEWAVLDNMIFDHFNPVARESLQWTKKRLTEIELYYLQQWPLTAENENFHIVHANLEAPESFEYVFSPETAMKNFVHMKKKLCFIGHTHVPFIFKENSSDFEDIPQKKITLQGTARYVVNVGSIGQPRDGDPRACYCIYDTEQNTVEMKRVVYNIAAAQRKIRNAGLPEFLAYRLALGK